MAKSKKAPTKNGRKPPPPISPPVPDGAGPEALAAYYRALNRRSEVPRAPKS